MPAEERLHAGETEWLIPMGKHTRTNRAGGSTLIYVLFISMVATLGSGYMLVWDRFPEFGRWVDAAFGLSAAIFIGSLVAVISQRALKLLWSAEPERHERKGNGSK